MEHLSASEELNVEGSRWDEQAAVGSAAEPTHLPDSP